jgi:hypothetical protein
MEFISASPLNIIPSYHVMNSEGELQDPTRQPPDISDEDVLSWYKNMVTGACFYFSLPERNRFLLTHGQSISWIKLCLKLSDMVVSAFTW